MDIIEIFRRIALANFVDDTFREVVGEIVDSPVIPILRRVQTLTFLPLVPMAEFTTTFIRRSNPPYLNTGSFFPPSCVGGMHFPRDDQDIIFHVLPEDAFGVDG